MDLQGVITAIAQRIIPDKEIRRADVWYVSLHTSKHETLLVIGRDMQDCSKGFYLLRTVNKKWRFWWGRTKSKVLLCPLTYERFLRLLQKEMRRADNPVPLQYCDSQEEDGWPAAGRINIKTVAI